MPARNRNHGGSTCLCGRRVDNLSRHARTCNGKVVVEGLLKVIDDMVRAGAQLPPSAGDDALFGGDMIGFRIVREMRRTAPAPAPAIAIAIAIAIPPSATAIVLAPSQPAPSQPTQPQFPPDTRVFGREEWSIDFSEADLTLILNEPKEAIQKSLAMLRADDRNRTCFLCNNKTILVNAGNGLTRTMPVDEALGEIAESISTKLCLYIDRFQLDGAHIDWFAYCEKIGEREVSKNLYAQLKRLIV